MFGSGSTKNLPLPDQKTLGLDSQKVSTNEMGRPVPIILGRRRVGVTWITDAFNRTHVDKKESFGLFGGEKPVGTTYSCSWAAIVGHGIGAYDSEASLHKVYFDNVQVYPDPGLEGIDRDMTADKVVRGIVTDGGSGYTRETITVTVNGDGTDATAEAVLVSGVIKAIRMTSIGSGYSTATIDITDSGAGAGAAVTAVLGAESYVRFDIAGYGNYRFYWGTEHQDIDPLLAALSSDPTINPAGPGENAPEEHGAYVGQMLLVAENHIIGYQRTNLQNVEVEVSIYYDNGWLDATPGNVNGDGNIVQFAVAVWENKRYGLGLPTYVSVIINDGDDTINESQHKRPNGSEVSFSGALPGEIAEGVIYFVRDATTDTYKISATLGGSAIDFSSSGSDVFVAGGIPLLLAEDSATDNGLSTVSNILHSETLGFSMIESQVATYSDLLKRLVENVDGYYKVTKEGLFAIGLSRHGECHGEEIDVTANATTDTFTDAAHGLTEGTPIMFLTGTMPDGLVRGETYRVTNPTADTFQLKAYRIPDAVWLSINADGATDTFTRVSHGLNVGTLVRFEGTMPTGLNEITVYSIANPTADTFQVETIDGLIDFGLGGNAAYSVVEVIDITSAGASLKYARAEVVIEFDETSLTDRPQIAVEGWETTFNDVRVKFFNRPNAYVPDAAAGPDTGNYLITGEKNAVVYDRPMIMQPEIADLMARNIAKVQALPRTHGKLKVRKSRLQGLDVGKPFRLHYAHYGLCNFRARCVRLVIPDPYVPEIEIEFEADRSVLAEKSQMPAIFPVPQTPATSLVPIVHARVVELPYFTAWPKQPYLAILASRPTQRTRGYVIWDATQNKALVKNQHFAVHGVFVAEVADEDSVFQVDVSNPEFDTIPTSISSQDGIQLNWLLFAGDEIMSISNVDIISAGRYELTVLREQFDTKRFTHALGADVFIISQADMLFQVALYDGNSLAGATTVLKLQPTANGQTLSLDGLFSNVVIDDGTDIVTEVGHTKIDGDAVQFTGVSLPGELFEGVTYYVVNAATDTYQVENTVGGGAIDFSAPGDTVRVTMVYPLLWTDRSKRWWKPRDLTVTAAWYSVDEDDVVVADASFQTASWTRTSRLQPTKSGSNLIIDDFNDVVNYLWFLRFYKMDETFMYEKKYEGFTGSVSVQINFAAETQMRLRIDARQSTDASLLVSRYYDEIILNKA